MIQTPSLGPESSIGQPLFSESGSQKSRSIRRHRRKTEGKHSSDYQSAFSQLYSSLTRKIREVKVLLRKETRAPQPI
jgi:hypothetical protein